jgi:SNF2 family DNA or RNA helicase
MKFNPHKYQIEAANFLLDKPRSFLYLGLGLGKTVITLSTIRRLILTGESKGALVITPIRPMYNTWPEEIKKWDHLNSLTHTILHGEEKGKRLVDKKVNIYLINYEGLKWLESTLLKVPPKDIPFDILVFDESSMLKSNSAKRFKILKRLIHKTGVFSRRYGLTGTPSPNSLQDIWSQFLLVDDGKRLGVSFTGFRDGYFYPLDFNGFKWALKYKAKENISNRVKDIVLRMRSEDYVDLPEKVDNKIVCDLPDDLRKQYKKLEKDFILQLTDNQEVTAFNAGVLAGKLRQFISGGMYLAHPEWLKIHNTKAEEVAQMIEMYSGEPALVAIQYKFEYDLMCDAMKNRPIPVIYGGTKNKETNRLIDLWNKGLLPVLIVHPQSISHGVNLQSGGRMIFWLSLPWSYEQYTQLNGRLYRQGQTKSVIVNHMLVKNTIDERVYSTLIAKHNSEESFMKSLVLTLTQGGTHNG